MKFNRRTSDYNNIATTRNLHRILVVLEEQNRPIIMKEIYEMTVTSSSKLKDALLWLSNNGILLKEKGKLKKRGKNGCIYNFNGYWYMINPKFLELRK